MDQRLYTIIDAILAIWRQRWQVLTVFALVTLLVGIATLVMPKTYRSDSKLFVRLGRENSAIDVTAGMGDRAVFALPSNRESEMNSIAAMIETKDLFGGVVDKVGSDRILKRKKRLEKTASVVVPTEVPTAKQSEPTSVNESASQTSSKPGSETQAQSGSFWQSAKAWFPDLILFSDQPSSQSATPEASASPDESETVVQSLVGNVQPWLVSIGILSDLEDRERAIIRLQKKTRIEVNKLSYVISVSHESYDPALAQEIVQTLVDDYIKLYARTHRPARGNEFLAQQALDAEERLKASEKDFEEFKTRTGLMSVVDQRKLFVDRIARLEDELLETTAAMRATESEVTALAGLLDGIPATQPIAKTAGTGNDGIDAMREEVFRLQVRREELVAKYNPGHPSVKEIDERLQKTQSAFASASADIVEQVEGPSKVYEGAKLQIVHRQPTLDALRSKAEELKKQLEVVRSEIAAFNDNEMMFLRLQRQEELCDDNYMRLKKSLQQSDMDYAMQDESMSNLSVFQPASLNPKPYRPNKLVNLLAGLFLGMVCGCALAVLRDFRRYYQSWAGLPERSSELIVLAEIPHQSNRLLVGVKREGEDAEVAPDQLSIADK